MKRIIISALLASALLPAFAEKKIARIKIDMSALNAGTSIYDFTYNADGRMATSSLTTNDALQYKYALSWEQDKLVCTRTGGNDALTETYFLNEKKLTTTYKNSDGAEATFRYDTDGYLISASGASDSSSTDTGDWSATATYNQQSLSKATFANGQDSYNITFTSSSKQDLAGLYIHLYDAMGFATGFFSGVMGKSSKMLPQKASTTIQSLPVTLTWTYTYNNDGLVTAYSEAATLIGNVLKAEITYCDVTKVELSDCDNTLLTITDNIATCPSTLISAYSLQGALIISGYETISLPAGTFIIKAGPKTIKAIIK